MSGAPGFPGGGDQPQEPAPEQGGGGLTLPDSSGPEEKGWPHGGLYPEPITTGSPGWDAVWTAVLAKIVKEAMGEEGEGGAGAGGGIGGGTEWEFGRAGLDRLQGPHIPDFGRPDPFFGGGNPFLGTPDLGGGGGGGGGGIGEPGGGAIAPELLSGGTPGFTSWQ